MIADNNWISKRHNNDYYSLQKRLSCFAQSTDLPWWKNIPFSCHHKNSVPNLRVPFLCKYLKRQIFAVYRKRVFWVHVNGYEMSWNWKWRMIIAVNFPIRIPLKPWFFFQASSFQLLKLENLLRWSFFTFIYNRSSKMNYFIYFTSVLKLLAV